MNTQSFRKKQLNKITMVEFYEKDIAVRQENDYIILDKSEILQLARIIREEQPDLKFLDEEGEK